MKYLGKNKRGTNEVIAEKLKVPIESIIGLKENPIRYLTNNKTGVY